MRDRAAALRLAAVAAAAAEGLRHQCSGRTKEDINISVSSSSSDENEYRIP
jgi:hypothetical protein